MKESELRKFIREEIQGMLTEGRYETYEMDHAEEDHDWKTKMAMQIRGDKNHTKWLAITKKQFEAIKKILNK